jgi:hypothetical protein
VTWKGVENILEGKMAKERFEVVKLDKSAGKERVVGVILSTVNLSEAKQRAKQESDNLTPEQKGHIHFQVRAVPANRFQVGNIR